MRATITLVLILLSFGLSRAQSTATLPNSKKKAETTRVFFNQGEQENYWAEKFFEDKYEKQFHDRFKGVILVINETTIKYDDKVLEIRNTDVALIPIFKKGIFYANIIKGNEKATVTKTREELDSMSSDEVVIYNLTRTDSTLISDFKELKFLHTPPQTKRFRFWLYNQGMAKPQLCFIELTNKHADQQSNMATFIEGSTLTFFKRSGLIM